MISNFPEEAEFIREVFDDAYIYIYMDGIIYGTNHSNKA